MELVLKLRVAVIDEASQISECQLWRPLMLAAGRFVLVGDQQQLPPLVKNEQARVTSFFKWACFKTPT